MESTHMQNVTMIDWSVCYVVVVYLVVIATVCCVCFDRSLKVQRHSDSC